MSILPIYVDNIFLISNKYLTDQFQCWIGGYLSITILGDAPLFLGIQTIQINWQIPLSYPQPRALCSHNVAQVQHQSGEKVELPDLYAWCRLSQTTQGQAEGDK